jgi:hypothetical protein
MDSNHSIAVIGQNNTPEMRPVMEFLSRFSESGPTVFYPDIPLFVHTVNQQLVNIEIVLVLQNRPLEYSPETIQQLINTVPLAQFLCCYSSWSESDGRNHSEYWPVSFRIPARAAIPRILNAIATIEGKKQNIPLSAGKDEVFLNTIPEMLDRESDSSNWTVFIDSADLEFRLMLKELINKISRKLIIVNSKQEAQCCLWDMDPLNEVQLDRLKEFRNQSPDSVIIPLMNFPQPEEVILLKNQFNITDVVPKLHLTSLLPDMIERSILKPEAV